MSNDDSDRDADLQIGGLRVWVHGRMSDAATDFYDGNWLAITATCHFGSSRVAIQAPALHLAGFAQFVDECERLASSLKGVAELSSCEPYLSVHLRGDGLGHIHLAISITPDHMRERHEFEDDIDQTYLPAILASCRAVLKRYPLREPEKLRLPGGA